MNLFSPYKYAANDLSMSYLFQIFGPMNNIIASNSSSITRFQQLLPEMFRSFNTIILAVGALVVVYVTIVGIMNTAHEGQFMGKDWNNLWIPIRTVLGISMLVPSASGYSYIQIIMMWVIIQGIGAANLVWDRVIRTLGGAFTEFGTVVPPLMEANRAIDDLFQSLTCAQTSLLRNTNPYTSVDGSSASGNDNAFFCNVNPGNRFCGGGPGTLSTTEYRMGPDAACGILEFCDQPKACADPNSMSCKACAAQIIAYANLMPDLTQAAGKLAKIDLDYQNYFYRSADPGSGAIPPRPSFVTDYCNKKGISLDQCVGGKKLPSPLGDASSAPSTVVEEIYWPAFKVQAGDNPDPIQKAKKAYADSIDTLSDVFRDMSAVTLEPQLQVALSQGWIMAGSYYQVLARLNSRAQNDSAPSTSVSTDIQVAPNNTSSPLYHYRTNYDAAARIVAKSGGGGSGGAAGRAAGPVARAAQGTTSDIDKSAKVMWAPEGVNPVAQLTMTGYTILFAIQMFYLGMIALSAIAGITTINIFIFGSGVDSPLESIWSFLFYFIIPVIWAAIGILLTIGATLAIYLPLVPFVIFTMGAVGWLFSTVEAMIAGPLVALGILSPGRHHEILGEAKPALMLLFNIFLRPTLMIFGLATAMLLCTVVAGMVNAGFATVKANISQDVGAMGINIITLILMLLAYTVIIVGALTKCFAAIYMVPEKVMRWIGGQSESYGEEALAGEVKAGAKSDVAAVGGVGKDMVGAASKLKGGGGGKAKGGKG